MRVEGSKSKCQQFEVKFEFYRANHVLHIIMACSLQIELWIKNQGFSVSFNIEKRHLVAQSDIRLDLERKTVLKASNLYKEIVIITESLNNRMPLRLRQTLIFREY